MIASHFTELYLLFMQTTAPNIPTAQSTDYIGQLRFPLAALVVLIHCNISKFLNPGMSQYLLKTSIVDMCSIGFTSFAVPLFFAISGYLFFYQIGDFTMEVYKHKLKRRVRTLLVPYIVWNLLALIIFTAKDLATGSDLTYPLSLNAWWGIRDIGGSGMNWLGYNVHECTAPLQVPLWFVRDLIVLTLLSPLLHFFLKKYSKTLLLILALLYFAHIWPN